MSEKKEMKNIFVANSVYPDVKAVFITKLKPIEEIINDCIFVIDTNALLLPYTISKDSLEQIKNTFSKLIIENKLYIPGQVVREFAKNRPNKLTEIYQQLSVKKSKLTSTDLGHYPLLETLEDFNEAIGIEKDINKNLIDLRKKIDAVLDKISNWNWDDPVSEIYCELFNDDVIYDLELNKEKENEIVSDMERRQLHKIPPGYKDSSKDDHGIGDILIWHTILELGDKFKKNVIFISGEEKTDWWHKSHEGRVLYPRYELIDEYRRCSGGKHFYITKLSSILSLLGANEKAIKEVKQQETKITFTMDNTPYAAVFIGANGFVLDGMAKVSDIEPFISDGVVFAAPRPVSEIVNAEIGWDEKTGTLTLTSSGKTMTLVIGTSQATMVQGEHIQVVNLGGSPKIINGRVVIPLSKICEAFGFFVVEDFEKTNAVLVYRMKVNLNQDNQE